MRAKMRMKFIDLKTKIQNRLAEQSNRWRFIFASLSSTALFLLPERASAGFLGFLGGIFGSIANGAVELLGTLIVWLIVLWGVSHILSKIVGQVFLFLINMLIGVSQYNSFLGSTLVTVGWAVTRDLANLFLVIALLVIAFATILDIQKFQAQKLLAGFLKAAILVNFSKMICGLLIDAAQVVMMTFVSGFSDTAAGNFIKMFRVNEWLQLAVTGGGTATAADVKALDPGIVEKIAGDFFTSITTNVFTTIVGFLGILAVLSMVIVLVVRIITLWFLIMVSPLAFVAGVMPISMISKYNSEWWSAFQKQLIVGPVIAFILWVSLASVAMSDQAFNILSDANQGTKLFAESNAAIAANKISRWENLALYFIPLVIFIMGAKWAVGFAGGAAAKYAGKATGFVSGYARKGLNFAKNQSVGSGRYSIKTNTMKGLKGEGGVVGRGTAAAWGAVGGLGLGAAGRAIQRKGVQMAGSQNVVARGLGRAMSTTGSVIQPGNITGAAGRARIKAVPKELQKVGTPLGIGPVAERRRKIEDTEASAQRTQDAAKMQSQTLRGQAAAARAGGDQAGAAGLEAKATAVDRIAKKQADNMRKPMVAEAKTALQEKGLATHGDVLSHFQNQIGSGKKPSGIDMMAGKEIMDESLKGEADLQIANAKAAAGAAGRVWTRAEEDQLSTQIAGQQQVVKNQYKAMQDQAAGVQPAAPVAAAAAAPAAPAGAAPFDPANIPPPPPGRAPVVGQQFNQTNIPPPPAGPAPINPAVIPPPPPGRAPIGGQQPFNVANIPPPPQGPAPINPAVNPAAQRPAAPQNNPPAAQPPRPQQRPPQQPPAAGGRAPNAGQPNPNAGPRPQNNPPAGGVNRNNIRRGRRGGGGGRRP